MVLLALGAPVAVQIDSPQIRRVSIVGVVCSEIDAGNRDLLRCRGFNAANIENTRLLPASQCMFGIATGTRPPNPVQSFST